MQPQFEFEWDDEKADENLRKHGVSFEEAETVFADAFSRIVYDPDHSTEEHRYIIIGYSYINRILFVCFMDRGASRLRIFSARKADRKERRGYEEKDKTE